ncbi:MAG: hypothetical protein ACRDTR_22525 [Rubrobacter sp.]
MDLRNRTPAAAGALAAGLLVEACGIGQGDPLNLEVVRDLAVDLERRLDALSHPTGEDDLVEAALACADLATLAACNLSDLPPQGEPLARAAVHLAAGSTHALVALMGTTTSVPEETSHAANALRDARGALWRADLAVRQIGEPE